MRWAVVTGTSRGLGAAVARELGARGWSVLGIARSPAARGLAGPGYRHVTLDLSDPAGLDAALDSGVSDGLGASLAPSGATRLALVNNAAALAPVGPATDLAAVALARHLAVNVVAPVRLAGALLARAPAGVPVRIVSLSSGAATRAYPGWTAYCAGKAALAQASAVLAAEVGAYPELAGRDLAVVDYAPGVVATDMQAELRALEPRVFPDRQRFLELFARGELVAPERPAAEIADLVERDDLPRHATLRYPAGRTDGRR